MIDLKRYAEESLKIENQRRNMNLSITELFLLQEKVKKLKQELENLQQESNIAAAQKNFEKGKEIKTIIQGKMPYLQEKQQELHNLILKVPNVLHHSVPYGLNEEQNIEIKRSGEIKFTKHHFDMDIFEENDFLSSRFLILKNKIPKLERALYSFMLDFLEDKGFEEFSVPFILTSDALSGSAHIPKDKDNMFKIEGEEKYLIPTGEPVLVNLGKNKIWNETKRFCTLSDCFRKEAGSAGKDTKGLIRLHQFKKCEMVCFTSPQESYTMLEEMLNHSCDILAQLEIPWRVLLLCSGDSPFTSAKTYDIEVPIGGKWREIASISNCTDFQSRNISCKEFNSKEFLHILNGSALAIGRTIATLLEVHFNSSTNSVSIPKALHKYLNFTTINF